jgi:hypothetical protein
MRIVELDASGWKEPLNFLEALKTALGSCHGHGDSPDAFVDSMIWGGMNSVEPPYTVKINKTAAILKEVTDYIRLMISIITEARIWRYKNRGDDIEVSISAPELLN